MQNRTDPSVFVGLHLNIPALLEIAFREGCAMCGVTRVETQDARWNESGSREFAQDLGHTPTKYGGGYGKRGASTTHIDDAVVHTAPLTRPEATKGTRHEND